MRQAAVPMQGHLVIWMRVYLTHAVDVAAATHVRWRHSANPFQVVGG